MNKLIFFSITILLTLFVSAQEKYLPLTCNIYYQMQVDSLIKNEITFADKSLVYGSFCDTCMPVVTVIVSNIVGTKYWVIRDDKVIKSGIVKLDSIFKYDKYRKTGAIEREKFPPNTFYPHLLCGVDTEFVIYRDVSCEFYFEYGKSIVSHKELKCRKKYREDWLKIIRKEVNSFL